MRAIPYNYYALLTILAMVLIVALKIDYGPMKLHEDNAVKGDIYTTPDRPYANAENEIVEEKGKVIDLVFPIVVLIIFCICGMLYTGGFFSGTGFVKAFSASDASVGLMLGSFFALVVTYLRFAVCYAWKCICQILAVSKTSSANFNNGRYKLAFLNGTTHFN